MPFSEVMDLALYDPELGFYATGGSAGRRGDFITAPEVGPLFGAVVARALDDWWREANEPDPFVVVEAGAGIGTLAIAILASRPACAPALRYVLVEQSAALRARHGDHLALESAAFAFAPDHSESVDPDVAPADLPSGPIVVSLAALPRVHAHVVLANELLDNLPVDLAECRDGRWYDVRVGLEDGRLVDVLVPSAASIALDATDGARVPRQEQAERWVRDALATAERVVAFDYADTTASMAARPFTDWLRTYRGHQRGVSAIEELGQQDVTCEVAVDQLPSPDSNRSQADWLRQHGLDELVEEGRQLWAERAHIGDLEAMRARSRMTEAAALTDSNGLGAFRVLEWRGR